MWLTKRKERRQKAFTFATSIFFTIHSTSHPVYYQSPFTTLNLTVVIHSSHRPLVAFGWLLALALALVGGAASTKPNSPPACVQLSITPSKKGPSLRPLLTRKQGGVLQAPKQQALTLSYVLVNTDARDWAINAGVTITLPPNVTVHSAVALGGRKKQPGRRGQTPDSTTVVWPRFRLKRRRKIKFLLKLLVDPCAPESLPFEAFAYQTNGTAVICDVTQAPVVTVRCETQVWKIGRTEMSSINSTSWTPAFDPRR